MILYISICFTCSAALSSTVSLSASLYDVQYKMHLLLFRKRVIYKYVLGVCSRMCSAFKEKFKKNNNMLYSTVYSSYHIITKQIYEKKRRFDVAYYDYTLRTCMLHLSYFVAHIFLKRLGFEADEKVCFIAAHFSSSHLNKLKISLLPLPTPSLI